MWENIKQWLFDPVVKKILFLLLALLVIWLIVRVIRLKWVPRIKDIVKKYRLNKLSGFVGFVVAVILIIIVFYQKLSGLTLALGLAGAGIAFALQEVIASVAGWMAIMFGGFFKTGDRIQLGGIKGDVIDIGVIRTTLMETGQGVDGDLYNGRIVRVANSFVFKEPVFNYSADFPFLWDEIRIPIQYGSDFKYALELFGQIAEDVAGDLTSQSRQIWKSLVNKFRIENAQTEPMVTLAANDNWIEITIRYVVNYKRRRVTKNALFQKILQTVDTSNGRIKLASGTYHIVGMPDLNVQIKRP